MAKNLICTTLKAIFSILDFFSPSDSRFSNSCISVKYCQILQLKVMFLYFFVCVLNRLPVALCGITLHFDMHFLSQVFFFFLLLFQPILHMCGGEQFVKAKR